VNKTERTELRRVIRARFKVLRTDIEQRKAELIAELDEALDRAHSADQRRWDDLLFTANQAIDEANRKVNDLCRDYYGKETWGERHDRVLVSLRMPSGPTRDRQGARFKGVNEIEARVRAAYVTLERREVELLESLAVDALESADAKAFMAGIPTIGELVPNARFEAITASMKEDT
jgi:hypothetical protein